MTRNGTVTVTGSGPKGGPVPRANEADGRLRALEGPPDLLRQRRHRWPAWARVLLIGAGSLAMVVGVAVWLTPIVTGSIPFYIVGLALLGASSERARRWINGAERKLPLRWRWKLRRGLGKIPIRRLRDLLHLPQTQRKSTS